MVDFVESTTGRFCASGFVVHNSGAQGTIKLVMAQVYDFLEQYQMWHEVKPLLQVHDELLFSVKKEMALEVAEYVKDCFEHCVTLSVPIKASSAIAETWGDIDK